MIPIAFPTALPAGAPVPPRFLHTEDTVSHPFSTVYRNAQTGSETETPEAPEPKAPPARKAAVNPKQSTNAQSGNPQSAKPDNPVVPVQVLPGPQAGLISMKLALSFDPGEDRDSGANSAPDAVSRSSGGGAPNAATQAAADTLPQPAPLPSPVAFLLNITPSDRKPETSAQAGALARKAGGSAAARERSVSALVPSSGNEESSAASESSADLDNSGSSDIFSSSDSGSSPAPPETNTAAVLKPEPPPENKPEAGPADIPALTVAPVQGLASPPKSSGAQQAPARAVTDAAPAAALETPPPPAPVSARQIDLTVPGGAGRPVDIRILQRGADVQVTVRTPDGDLAQSLRHNLPELSATLSRNGLREEALSTAQSHSSGDGGRGENSPGNGGGQAWQDPEEREQPAHTSRSKAQPTGAFTEIIHNEKKNT